MQQNRAPNRRGQALRSSPLAALVGVLSLLASCSSKPTPPPDYADVIRQANEAPRAIPAGEAAIRPRLSGVPAFAAEDLRAFAQTAGVPHGVARKVRVTDALFLNSDQVSQRLGGVSTGLPSETPLGYVEMEGEFTFFGPPGATARFERGFEVFDAKTGNLMMAGGLPNRGDSER